MTAIDLKLFKESGFVGIVVAPVALQRCNAVLNVSGVNASGVHRLQPQTQQLHSCHKPP